jgi:hypothetical protein
VQAQAALVGAESRVELDAVAAVDLEVAGIVLPDDAELDDALGDRGDLEGGAELGVLLEQRAVLESEGELCGKPMSDPCRESRDAKRYILLPLYACSNSGSGARCDDDMVTGCLG